jgi:hypothetical protein
MEDMSINVLLAIAVALFVSFIYGVGYVNGQQAERKGGGTK